MKKEDEMWEKNFYNAKSYFESNGSYKVRSRLKEIWFDNFRYDLNKIINAPHL